jgi:hypothetical protein
MRYLATALLLAALGAAPANAEPAHTGYPNAIASVGDSSSTGYNADSAAPPHDEHGNSWATGDNPAVQSQYLRILAHNPRIRGHAANGGRDGLPPSALPGEIGFVAAAHPDYLVIGESYTPDFCGGHNDFAQYAAEWRAAIRTASLTLPNARILVAGIWPSGQLFDAVKSSAAARAFYSDGTLCDPQYDANGNPSPQRVAFVAGKVEQYDSLIAAACAQFVHCRFDAAITDVPRTLEDFSSDFSHASVAGNALTAEQTWSATFDFTDAKAPVSKGRLVAGKAVLTATDNVGVAGFEYRLNGKAPWIRYSKPVALKPGQSLTWRAVDVNGNSEATKTLRR